MKKFPKPWFRPLRNVWYVTLDGKQHNLGSDKKQAFERYTELLNRPKSRPVTPDSLANVIDSFLEWVHRQRSPDTYEWYRYRLERFVRKYPSFCASEVKPFHVQEWVDGYPLSQTSRRNYLRTVKRCLAWATKQGYLDKNPVEALEIPSGERRETVLSDNDLRRLFENIRDEAFRDLVTVTIESGCRPQESLRVEARHVDLVNQRWVFSKSESKNKKLSRIVYMTDTAMEIVRRNVERFPTGKLFRNSLGRAWTTAAVNNAFTNVRIRIGQAMMRDRKIAITEGEIDKAVPKLASHQLIKGERIEKSHSMKRQEARRKLRYKAASELAPKWSLYALRHTWATRALKRGIDPLTVAILMGHSDPSMLSRVYQHLSLNPVHMLEQAKKAGVTGG